MFWNDLLGQKPTDGDDEPDVWTHQKDNGNIIILDERELGRWIEAEPDDAADLEARR